VTKKPNPEGGPLMINNTQELKEILFSNINLEEFILARIKEMMETLMQAELTELLKYDKYAAKGHNSGNSRNGYYKRSYETKYGKIDDLNIPRDRNGEFEQQLIPAYRRRDGWLEDMVIQLYANGVSTREIGAIIEKLYGNKYSPTTVSNITDVAIEEINKWRQRPLNKRYSILFIDAMSVKLRRDTVANDSVYFILGIDEEGYREVLDFYIGTTESSYVWEDIFASLRQRGVTEVLLGVMDGLPGLEDAFNRVFVKADIQRCVVHKVRNTIRKVRKKDLPQILEDLKSVYESATKDQAMIMLDEFSTKWRKSYPKVVDSWNNTSNLFTYYDYPQAIRKAIYTTNWIERFNKEVRRLTKTKNSFPNEDALSKIVYFKVIQSNSKWSTRKMKGFVQAHDELQEMFLEKYGNGFTQDS
jgi:putative transposase